MTIIKITDPSGWLPAKEPGQHHSQRENLVERRSLTGDLTCHLNFVCHNMCLMLQDWQGSRTEVFLFQHLGRDKCSGPEHATVTAHNLFCKLENRFCWSRHGQWKGSWFIIALLTLSRLKAPGAEWTNTITTNSSPFCEFDPCWTTKCHGRGLWLDVISSMALFCFLRMQQTDKTNSFATNLAFPVVKPGRANLTYK